MLELAFIVCLVVALAVHERVQRASERRELLAAVERERQQWFRERQLLLNRIKPETAQFVEDPDVSPVTVSAVRYDDDDDYWESKEELAERMMAEDLHGGS